MTKPCDLAILDVLALGAHSAQEIADAIRRKAREDWAERHGYFFEWETDEEPLGARLLAHGDARQAGLKLLAYEIDPRLRAMEKRGEVVRIQIEGHRPMLWTLDSSPASTTAADAVSKKAPNV